MANKANLLQVNIGQTVDEQVFNKASEGHNVFGCALVANGNMLIQQQDGPTDWETFQQLQDQYKTCAIICYFGTHDKDSAKEDIQPYLVEDENGVHMAFFAAGDYTNLKQPKSSRAPEHRLFEQKFKAHFTKYLDEAKDETSLKGFMDYLRDPSIDSSLMNSSMSFGVIKLIASTGETKTWPQSQHYGKFSWGDMADVNGYEEAPTRSAASSPVLKSFFGKKSTTADQPPTPAKTEVQKAVVPSKTETAVSDVPDGKVMARPSGTLKHDKQVQQWYQVKFAPNLIKNWKSRPWVAIDADKVDANTECQNLTALGDAIQKAEQKKIEAEEIAARTIPPRMKDDFQKKFLESKKVKDKMTGMVTFPTLEEMKADEKRFPTFYDQTKLQLSQTNKWGDEEIDILARDYLPILKSWLRAERHARFKYQHEHPVKEKVEETTPKTTSFFGKKAA